MDHLPLPRNPIRESIRVPILSIVNYDGGDFETYPERQGWGTRTIATWKSVFERPPPELAAFLQRWLYFGLLEAIFNKRIDIASSFVSQDRSQGHPFLTTKQLPNLAQELLRNRSYDSMERTRVIFGAMGTAALVHQMLSKDTDHQQAGDYLNDEETLVKFILTEAPTDPRDPRVVIANTLLLELLVGLFCSLTGKMPEQESSIQKGPMSTVWKVMRQHGWCPAQLVPMFEYFTTSGLLFLDNLERPNPWEKHPMIRIHRGLQPKENTIRSVGRADDICKFHRCQFRQLSDDTYRTKHTKECPGCMQVVADLDTLCNILQRGKIPLIMSISSEDENGDIMLIEAEPDMAYVAISHVWSDGLGNVQGNALHRCQVLRLSKLIRNLPGHASIIVLFWLDTICVPPDAAHRAEAQNMALQMMRQTYEDATAVLVLDSWLLDCTTREMSDIEVLMRIFNSLWNRRLWTYQEGALARHLIFQFEDRAYELDSAMDRLYAAEDTMVDLTFKSSLDSRYRSLRSFKYAGLSSAEKLATIFSAVKFRATSVATDEALCLAALLGFDMKLIVNADPASRMEEFWRLTTSVPVSILHYHGPTFDKPGFRWAPRSLLLSRSNVDPSISTSHVLSKEGPANASVQPSAQPSAQPTSRGLLVQFSGLIINTGASPIGPTLTVKDEKRKCYQLNNLWTEGPHIVLSMEDINGTFREALTCNPASVYGCQGVAFLDLSDRRSRWDARAQSQLEETMLGDYGILVAVTEERNEIIYARKLCRCLSWNLRPSVHGAILQVMEQIHPGVQPYERKPAIDRRSGIVKHCVGRTRPTTQKWCID